MLGTSRESFVPWASVWGADRVCLKAGLEKLGGISGSSSMFNCTAAITA